MNQSHTTNEVTYESNAVPSKKVTKKFYVGMLPPLEVTTFITEPSQCVCACTLIHTPAQTHLYQQFEIAKWPGLKQLSKGCTSPYYLLQGQLLTAKQMAVYGNTLSCCS